MKAKNSAVIRTFSVNELCIEYCKWIKKRGGKPSKLVKSFLEEAASKDEEFMKHWNEMIASEE